VKALSGKEFARMLESNGGLFNASTAAITSTPRLAARSVWYGLIAVMCIHQVFQRRAS